MYQRHSAVGNLGVDRKFVVALPLVSRASARGMDVEASSPAALAAVEAADAAAAVAAAAAAAPLALAQLLFEYSVSHSDGRASLQTKIVAVIEEFSE